MIAVVQRVLSASVLVNGQPGAAIDRGLLILVAAQKRDRAADAVWLANRIAGLRVFEDADGKMNLSCAEANGKFLVVSNFTVAANTRNGKRPSFDSAATFEQGKTLYDKFVEEIWKTGIDVTTGVFGADMLVNLVNDGPITLIVESPE